jgi:tRNA (guanine-N7-)-methyltransferase
MNRRALRKIDPALDLSGNFRSWEELPQPFEAAAMFGRAAPVELEIGSGKGLFLLTASGESPERNFLGCEISRKYARFAAARLARAGRTNAVVIHGDARRLLAECLPEASLAACHVYFPDPWWKQRHLRRRIMNETFVRDLERGLCPGGRLHFWTDVEEYFRLTLDVLARATQLQGPLEVAERPVAHAFDYRTHFERRMRLHQVPVYRAEYRRPEAG